MSLIRTLIGVLVVFALSVSAGSIPLDKARLKKKGSAKIGLKSGVISLQFSDPGWDSGVSILPPEGQKYWDFSQWKVLAADVENLSKDKQLRLNMYIWVKDDSIGKKRDANAGIALNPGEKRSLKLIIPHRSVYGTPKGVRGAKELDSDKVDKIEFFMQWPFESKTKGLVNCAISNIRLEKPLKDSDKRVADDKFFPFIDQYGQFVHADWPEKIHSTADLQRNHKLELKQLAAMKRPKSWDRFGGWKYGPKLKATGYFRTEKYKGKWYFVDPEGHLFFSQGLDVLYAHTDATRTKGHEKWFMSDMPKSGALAFTDTNLKLKYGKEDYEPDFYAVLVKRMEAWGFNTIGDWCAKGMLAQGKVPYTLQLSDYNRKLPKISGSKVKFYDVFDSRYVLAMKTLIPDAIVKNPQVEKSLTDPLCIGYFIDNELNFGNRKLFQLVKDLMKSPAKQVMKQEFVSDLKVKYMTIDKLNAAWNTKFADWNAMLSNSKSLPRMTKECRIDASTFMTRAFDQYFRLGRDAIKSFAPHRLYLGCRFISTDGVRRKLYEASKKYCDVLTVNVYSHSTANLTNESFPDMPVLIGEFHFGVYDRGMFSPGLCPAGTTQQERALAYTRFVQGALVNPHIVGTHWFQFRDQPLTGRWDGEGYAIGFVDVADTPYPEMTKASRFIGEEMYNYRMKGKLSNSMR